MIEPTTSATPGTAEEADQGASAQASSRSADADMEQASRSNASEQVEKEQMASEDVESSEAAADASDAGSEATSDHPETDGRPADSASHRDEASEEDEEPEESEADKVARLEREGDVAADYLEGLLDIADVDGDIDLDIEGDRALVDVVGSDLKRLVGADGSVLDALQELTRLAVLRETGGRSRLMLDVGGFRAGRRQELEKRAAKVADDVSSSGNPVRMDPMTPFERKIVHDTVAAKGLTSESEGEEPHRRVVVKPS